MILRIDREPGARRFQGVWLEQADGARWVIDYRARAVWRSFEDRDVIADGACYTPPPEVQAIGAVHYRVDRLQLADPSKASHLIEIGPIETLHGSFSRHVWDAGTKLAGERTTTFLAGDTEYWLIDMPDDPPIGAPVVVGARRCIRSPFVAAPAGDVLWIVDVRVSAASRLPPTG